MQFFLHFFTIFSAAFPYIWPLAGPNIAKKGWPLLGKALDGFGMGLEAANFGNAGFKCLQALSTPNSRFDPKVKSSKMGLSIDPRQFLSRTRPFFNIWPR